MIGEEHAQPFEAMSSNGWTSPCFLHIGTHKTGTTSLQRVLATNDGLFAQAGIHVPSAGRSDDAGGHHNIAWELNDDERFDVRRGTFADVLAEIAQRRAPRVCLSSEDFEYLYARPDALHTLADGVRRIGYRPVVIAYLRPQAGYAESLYAELVRHGLAVSFEAFLESVLATGEFQFNERWRFRFDYERLLEDFAAAVGPGGIIARRYETGANDIVRDFLPLIGADEGHVAAALSRSPRLNAGLRCADVLRQLEQNVRASRTPGAPVGVLPGLGPAGRFDPIHLEHVRRIVERFNPGNIRVHEKYGALVPCISGRDLVGDLAAAAGIDPAGQYRKRSVEAHARRLQLRSGHAGPVSSSGPAPAVTQRPTDGLFAPQLQRPALLEAVIVFTAAIVAVAALAYGERIASTALVEFGLLSIIVAVSASALLVRFVVESRAVIADYRFFDEWGSRLTIAGYGIVGVYALVNALLDVGLARYEPDMISYPATIATAAAALVLTAVQPLRRRVRGEISRDALVAGVRDDRLYLGCCYVALAGQVVHAILPDWWLDTGIDVLVVGLMGAKVYQIRQMPRAWKRGLV